MLSVDYIFCVLRSLCSCNLHHLLSLPSLPPGGSQLSNGHWDVSRFKLFQQWPTMTSFVNNWRSLSLRMDMPYGTQVQRDWSGPYKSAMSVSYAGANSTAFSTLYSPRTIHLTRLACQSITNRLSLMRQIISTRALLVAPITVQARST